MIGKTIKSYFINFINLSTAHLHVLPLLPSWRLKYVNRRINPREQTKDSFSSVINISGQSQGAQKEYKNKTRLYIFQVFLQLLGICRVSKPDAISKQQQSWMNFSSMGLFSVPLDQCKLQSPETSYIHSPTTYFVPAEPTSCLFHFPTFLLKKTVRSQSTLLSP